MRAHLKVAPHPSQRAHSSTVPLRRGCSSAYLSGNATSQGCESEPLGDLSQYRLFTFRKQSTLDLTFQDPVLSRQIFVPQQEFLTDRSGDLGHHPRPKHLGFPLNLPPTESEIVDAVFQSEKSIRGEPVESCKLRYFNSFEFLDPTRKTSAV